MLDDLYYSKDELYIIERCEEHLDYEFRCCCTLCTPITYDSMTKQYDKLSINKYEEERTEQNKV